MDDKKILKYFGGTIVIVLVFVLGFSLGRVFPTVASGGLIPSFTSSKSDSEINFDLFWNVWNTMTSQYVDAGKVNKEAMYYGAIKGMVNSYDDAATLFLDPKETEQFNDNSEGKAFEGIGAELGYDNGQIVVVAPIEGSPAMKAGLKAGDILLKIDGKEIKSSETIYDVVQRIRGKSGTNVTLTVLPKGGSTVKDITITRGQIDLPSVEFKTVKNESSVAIIDVSRFTDASVMEWEKNWDKAVDQVVKSNAKALIIDLRGNPGGYFDSAVYAANEFLPKGTIVSKQQNRQGNTQDFKVTRKGKLLDIPVVVLVNGSSASASEILSGALQKNNRATIIGEKTYGKGTAQSVIPLANGASLHITTLKWLLPDGTWINKDNPIKPNVEVTYSEADFLKGIDNQMQKAVEVVKTKIK